MSSRAQSPDRQQQRYAPSQDGGASVVSLLRQESSSGFPCAQRTAHSRYHAPSHSFASTTTSATTASSSRNHPPNYSRPSVSPSGADNPFQPSTAPRETSRPDPINVVSANAWSSDRLPRAEAESTPSQDPFVTPTEAYYSAETGVPRQTVPLTQPSPPCYSPPTTTDGADDSEDGHQPSGATAATGKGSGSDIKPSLRLMFSELSSKDTLLLVLPGIALAIGSGVLPTLMAKVIGHAYDALDQYNPQARPSSLVDQADKDKLMREILKVVYLLLGLAAGTLLLSTLMISFWVCVGERVSQRLRIRVFAAVAARKMAWFDMGMGMEADEKVDDDAEKTEEGGLGAGGLMAKFVREIDDVRIGTSRASGEVVQALATSLASLILALVLSWSLTLVILAGIPVTVLVSIVCEVVSNPLLIAERKSTAQASGQVERTVIAINTVKAFNAEDLEASRLGRYLEQGSVAFRKVLLAWGARYGLASALSLTMFVQGFWYGSHLVSKGKLSPGTVMTVFFTCLLVATQLIGIIENLSYIDKAKIGAANMARLMHTPATEVRPGSTSSAVVSPTNSLYKAEATGHSKHSSGTETIESIPMTPLTQEKEPWTAPAPPISGKRRGAKAVPLSLESIPHPAPYSGSATPPQLSAVPRLRYGRAVQVQPMRRVRPSSCQGEIVLRNISFSYPSRPDVPILRNVDMFFPAAEMTYVVGGSGSGKSTIAQLLLRIYEPNQGSIELDDQMLAFLDREWCREHIAAVSQTPIVFDLSVHDNVALGLVGSPAWRKAQSQRERATGDGDGRNMPQLSREAVQAACRVALLHDFVRDLPDGYETKLGQKGASLSGGQKQRLAIARARIRDPTILILDEATSALDPTSRLLVHEAIKHWRRGKTTIVITHDLSQVSPDDFVYLLEHGEVAEQGYRNQLERSVEGRFRAMLDIQQSAAAEVDQADMLDNDGETSPLSPTGLDEQATRAMEATHLQEPSFHATRRSMQRLSALPLFGFNGAHNEDGHPDNAASALLSALIKSKGEAQTSAGNKQVHLRPLRLTEMRAAQGFLEDASRLEATGLTASNRRLASASASRVTRRIWEEKELLQCTSGPSGQLEQVRVVSQREEDERDLASRANPTVRQTVRWIWATVPSRTLLLLGAAISAVGGTLTSFFSFCLTKLLSTMGRPDLSSTVVKWALLVLLIAMLEGAFNFVRYVMMNILADHWVKDLRQKAYAKVLRQDRAWFDKPTSSAGNICTSIVKDAEDARNLVGMIVGQVALITSMISLGLIWAMVVGWELTLAGLAVAPVFLVCLTMQNRVVSKREGRNKIKREQVGKRFYDMVSNVRGIRAMALEPVFERNFQDAVLEAQRCGMRAAAITGLGFGLAQALTYLAEAVMFLVGTVLIIRGRYDFDRMMQVFNLILFAVTFAANVLESLPSLSKSMRAAADLETLLSLPVETSESSGEERPAIQGQLTFDHVAFAYALRPDVPVLSSVEFRVEPGECIALVGGSGSGKSTIASLVQRLYEPNAVGGGAIYLDSTPLSSIDVKWLREHISVVSQHPNLFDMTIAENIAYGANAPVYDAVTASPIDATTMERVEAAARSANVHDFILALPRGYQTSVGESASLISGGQAQRIAIARALMRTRSRLLILDECTSALDIANQTAIVQTLMDGDARKRGITTLVVTHKVEMMKKCDRILVVKEGRIAQQGTFEELMKVRGGAFAALARGGEWGA